MRRAPSEDLFRLIKSLNRGEKRNFKLLAGLLSGEKDKKYLELFDMIDRQSSYNEAKLVKHFGDLYGGQLSVGKNYLYKLIIRSLVYYSSGPTADLNSYKEEIRILMNKGLFGQAGKRLRKAIRTAEELEDFHTLHLLLGYEFQILSRTRRVKDLDEQFKRINEEKKQVMAKLLNVEAYHELSSKVYAIRNEQHVAQTPEDHKKFDDILGDDVMADVGNALSNSAKIEYYYILRRHASFVRNFENEVLYSEKLLEVYDSNPVLRNRFGYDYFMECANSGSLFFRAGRLEEAFGMLGKLKAIRDEVASLREQIDISYLKLLIVFGVELGRPDKVLPLLESLKLDPELDAWKFNKKDEFSFAYVVAIVYFMAGEYSKSLSWINSILNQPKSTVGVYLMGLTQLLNLLVHFELGNYIYIENQVPRAKRFFEKNGALRPFEQIFLRGITKIAHTAGTDEMIPTMEKLKEEIPESSVFGLFEVWLGSKISGKATADFQRETAPFEWPEDVVLLK